MTNKAKSRENRRKRRLKIKKIRQAQKRYQLDYDEHIHYFNIPFWAADMNWLPIDFFSQNAARGELQDGK